MADKLLTLSEAANIMRCSYSKAHRMARSGSLPFKQLGANWFISKSTLYKELGLEYESEVTNNVETKQPA